MNRRYNRPTLSSGAPLWTEPRADAAAACRCLGRTLTACYLCPPSSPPSLRDPRIALYAFRCGLTIVPSPPPPPRVWNGRSDTVFCACSSSVLGVSVETGEEVRGVIALATQGHEFEFEIEEMAVRVSLGRRAQRKYYWHDGLQFNTRTRIPFPSTNA